IQTSYLPNWLGVSLFLPEPAISPAVRLPASLPVPGVAGGVEDLRPLDFHNVNLAGLPEFCGRGLSTGGSLVSGDFSQIEFGGTGRMCAKGTEINVTGAGLGIRPSGAAALFELPAAAAGAWLVPPDLLPGDRRSEERRVG